MVHLLQPYCSLGSKASLCHVESTVHTPGVLVSGLSSVQAAAGLLSLVVGFISLLDGLEPYISRHAIYPADRGT